MPKLPKCPLCGAKCDELVSGSIICEENASYGGACGYELLEHHVDKRAIKLHRAICRAIAAKGKVVAEGVGFRQSSNMYVVFDRPCAYSKCRKAIPVVVMEASDAK